VSAIDAAVAEGRDATWTAFSTELPDGKAWLCAVAKRSYRIVAGARSQLLDRHQGLVFEPETLETGPETTLLLAETDFFCALKPLTDVIVAAKAYSHRGPLRCVDTGLDVGPVRKIVRVFGERRVQVAQGRLSFSEPERFEQSEVGWDLAYGGRDLHAERLEEATPAVPGAIAGSLAYPRNRFGNGYWMDLDRDRLHGEKAPRLEDPRDPVTPDRLLARDYLDWIDRPSAAGYGAVDIGMFPRHLFCVPAKHRPPTRPVYEIAAGALSAIDLAEAKGPFGPPDFRVYNSAPTGQAVARLSGAERVKLWNLHPKHELLEFDLPGDRPRFWIEPPGAGRREIPVELGTILLEPEKDRVTLTWGGRLEVAGPYTQDVCNAMAGGPVFRA
jgi:hypothetical protein